MPEQGNSVVFKSALSAKVIKASGEVIDKGIIATRVVTTEGVNALVQAFIGAFTLSNFKYHASGTDTSAEAIGDTQATIFGGTTPAPVAGTQVVGGSANIYRTVATIPYVSTLAITSHGLLDNAVKASSKLWDRSVFAAINVVNGDSVEFTYELTCNAGG